MAEGPARDTDPPGPARAGGNRPLVSRAALAAALVSGLGAPRPARLRLGPIPTSRKTMQRATARCYTSSAPARGRSYRSSTATRTLDGQASYEPGSSAATTWPWAPDLRGDAPSDAAEGVEAYAMPRLLGDAQSMGVSTLTS